MSEVGLLDDPIQAMQTRLQQLLADWPENPILTQLLVLCQRLTGEHVSQVKLHLAGWSQCSSCSNNDESATTDGMLNAD